MVRGESTGTVRAALVNRTRPRSGSKVITGGAPGIVGEIRKSTLLSLKASAETGAAYHHERS